MEVFGAEERKEVMDVLETGALFRYGHEHIRKGMWKAAEFESEVRKQTGAKFAHAVSSGSTAVTSIMAAAGVGHGDEVIVPPYTFVAPIEAVFLAGALPVFAEIDESLCLSPEGIEAAVTPNTKAVLLIHMCGAAARIKEILEIAQTAGIPVLEDTAQAAGSRIGGKHLGSFGACGTFSFDSVKTMTTGEGGMIITDSKQLWQHMSEYHDHGHDHAVNPGGRGGEGRSFVGFNYRMMEIQGAIGIAQLAKLDGMVAAQQANKNRLKEAVSKIPGVSFRKIVDEAGDSATFLGFFLQDKEQRIRVNMVLSECGVPAICFAENTWHFYPKWEHLLSGATLTKSGWPFAEPGGKKRVVYDPEVLPESALKPTAVLALPLFCHKVLLPKAQFCPPVVLFFNAE